MKYVMKARVYLYEERPPCSGSNDSILLKSSMGSSATLRYHLKSPISSPSIPGYDAGSTCGVAGVMPAAVFTELPQMFAATTIMS